MKYSNTPLVARLEQSEAKPKGIPAKRLFFLDEILVIENVRRRSDELETDPGVTLVAHREKVFAVHYRFMRSAVSAVMNYLINAGLRHRLAGKEYRGVPRRAATTAELAFVSAQHETARGGMDP
jgi:hypothetical protein